MTSTATLPEYDVFISYRWVSPDKEWVRGALVPALEAAGLRPFLDVVDFVPGRDLILEMTRAGQSSRRVLCVISPDYFDGNRMAGFEALAARRRDPSGSESKVIPLLLRESQIPEWLSGLVAVDWTRNEDHPREWQKLLHALGASVQNARAPAPVPQSSAVHGISASSSMQPDPGGTQVGECQLRPVTMRAFNITRFRELKEYACLYDGLRMSNQEGIAWAEAKLRETPPFDLPRFKELKEYACSYDGLRMSNQEGIDWADEKLRDNSQH